MKPCALPAGAPRGRRAMRGPGCAALWVLLLAQVCVQVSHGRWGQGPPRLPSRCPPPHRGVAAVFQQAPARAVGPAAASPGSSSVRRPPGAPERPGWVETSGKCARGVPVLAVQPLVSPYRSVMRCRECSQLQARSFQRLPRCCLTV